MLLMTQGCIQNISNKLKETMQQLKRNKFQDKLEVAVFLKNDKYSKVILISKMKFILDLSLMTKPPGYQSSPYRRCCPSPPILTPD